MKRKQSLNSKEHICIRADGSLKIGLGHLIRCFALANMLKTDFRISFFAKEIPDEIFHDITNSGFTVKRIKDEEDFLNLLTGKEIVVLDHYDLNTDYQLRIKKKGCKLVCIDDLHDKEFYADLIINHSPGIISGDYDAQDYTTYALGPEYALLRPAFLEAAGIEKEIKEVKEVMICFGGSDLMNLTESVLQVVKSIEEIQKISVILGAAYPYRKSIDAIAGNDLRIKVLSSLDEEAMLTQIKEADFAVIPSSGILYEVIAGGCIPLICYYAENQRKLFNYFQKNSMLPFFNAVEFNAEELRKVLYDILNKKNSMDEIPLRKKIRESSFNNLNKFKQLVNG